MLHTEENAPYGRIRIFGTGTDSIPSKQSLGRNKIRRVNMIKLFDEKTSLLRLDEIVYESKRFQTIMADEKASQDSEEGKRNVL